MKFKCPKVREEKLIWLQEIANNDIYRIDNELSKISMFDDQDSMFDCILNDNGYGDLSSFNIYNLSNNISKNNVNEVRKILLEIDNIDVEPYGLVTNLIREFKNILKVQMFPNATYEKLHMTEKQYKAVRYYCCGIFNNETLIKCYRFLLDFDRRIKEGEYSNMSNNRIIDHIINNIVFRK
jgi:DNA polymerase III delta subunit